MRSGMEMVDCEKLRALARPDSLKGRPAQSSGCGPPPRSSASSWFLEAQEPDKSISASAGRLTESTSARLSAILLSVMFHLPLCIPSSYHVASYHMAEHAVGFQPASLVCFLNCELRMHDSRRYMGSVTTIVTTIRSSPLRSFTMSKYSVRRALSL